VEKCGGARGATDDNVAMRVACWISKATRAQAQARTSASMHARTHTEREYVILTAFAQQQLFRERASMLRYACIACLVGVKPEQFHVNSA
jgi:hypothetical protein